MNRKEEYIKAVIELLDSFDEETLKQIYKFILIKIKRGR